MMHTGAMAIIKKGQCHESFTLISLNLPIGPPDWHANFFLLRSRSDIHIKKFEFWLCSVSDSRSQTFILTVDNQLLEFFKNFFSSSKAVFPRIFFE